MAAGRLARGAEQKVWRMHAEARNCSDELFKLVDRDGNGLITASEYAVAQGVVAEVCKELLLPNAIRAV